MSAVSTASGVRKRTVLGLSAVLALVITLVAPAARPAVADDGVRSVSGVVSLPAGVPADWLGAVQVSAQPVSGIGYKWASVDPVTGAYSLADLTPGSYRIQFSVNQIWNGAGYVRPNLVGEYYNDATDWNSATVVDVSAASASNIDAELATGRTISGHVELPEGADPAWLSAITVNASAMTGSSGYTQVDPVTGNYSITGLRSGSYQVQFNVGTYWDGSTSVRPNLVSEYYDNATDWSTASAVDVSTGDKAGIDAALEPGRSITGTVTLPAGAPSEWLSSVTVNASTTTNGSTINGPGATPDPETGEYTITGLAPGVYQVGFRVMTGMPGSDLPDLVDEYYDNAYTPSTATPVDLSGADATGVDATMESGRSISGTIALPGDAPAEWMKATQVSVFTPDGEYLGYGYGNTAQIDTATGAYKLSRLPAGDFIVQFSASGYHDGATWHTTDIASEYYDNAATRDTATIVSTSDGNATGINATLGHGAGIDLDLDASALLHTGTDLGIGISITDLDGNVLTSYGDPLPQDGHYPITMGNLTPGDYRIAVTTSTWDEQANTSTLESAQFLRFGTATTIQLTAGHTETGQVTARAADATIIGNIRAEGYATTGNILGSALPYEKLDGNWIRIPEVHFDTTQNGNTPYSLTVPSGTYTVGYETDYATTTTTTQEQWWNGKQTLATADPITLSTGQTRTDINGTIHPDGGSAPVAPSVPRSVSASAGQGSATVAWKAPASDGGAPVSSYTVKVFPGGLTRTTTDRSIVISGLQAGTPYTFSVVARNTANLVSPESAPTSPVIPLRPIVFIDTAGHAFESQIAWLAANGISTGWQVEANTYEFRPNAQILRGEMATFLYRLAGQPVYTPPTVSPFIDVPTDFVFYKQIAWLADSGISRGWDTSNGKEFRPFLTTSRDVMATFLHRFRGSPLYTPKASPFRDVSYPNMVFSTEILWLAAQGISTGWDVGYGCYEYRPYQNVTRSEMAAFIYRMQNGGTPPLTGNTCVPIPPPPSPLVSGSVTSGAFCSQEVAGWYGYTSGGTLMRCTTLPTDSRLRWRQA